MAAVTRRLSDIGLACSLLAMTLWATWGVRPEDWMEYLDVLSYISVTLLLVVLSLLRPAPKAQDQRWWVWAACLVSTLSFLFYQGNPPLLFALVIIHLLGDLALIYLGRSFSIMPARRAIKSEFFYRWVRHPVYTSYAIADIVFLSYVPSVRNLLVSVLAIGLYALRAHLEEVLLREDPAYLEYSERTRYRFIPGLY